MFIQTYVCSLFSAYALKRTSFRSLIKSQVKRVNTTQKCWIHLHIAKRLFSLFFSHFFPLPATSVCTQSSFMPQGSNNNSFDPFFFTQFKSEHSLFEENVVISRIYHRKLFPWRINVFKVLFEFSMFFMSASPLYILILFQCFVCTKWKNYLIVRASVDRGCQ